MKKNYEELINNYSGGDLDLSGCTIKKLELGAIEGSLNLSKCTIESLSIGWVSSHLNLSGADIKNINCAFDAESIDMSNTKIKKLPSHIYTGSLNLEKSSITKLNTDIQTSVLNIRGTKLEQFPKNLRVHRLVVDSKTAKNISLNIINQCDEMDLDGRVFSDSRSSGSFEFCSVCSCESEHSARECACV